MRIPKSSRELKDLALCVISPDVIFSLVWVGQFSAHALSVTGLDSPSWTTWLILLSGIICFLLGSGFAMLVIRSYSFAKKINLNQKQSYRAYLRNLNYLLLVSLVLSFASAFVLLKNIQTFDLSFLASLKTNLLEESATGKKANLFLVYPLIFNALISIYYICVNGRSKKVISFVVFLVSSVLCLFSGSRAILIFFWIALVPQIVYMKSVYKLSAFFFAIGIIGALLASIFLYPVIFHGAAFDISPGSYLINYASVYMFSGVAAFNFFLENGQPTFDCALTVPNILVQLSSFFVPETIANCPKVYPEVLVPLSTNIYTLFYPITHDFGIPGLLFYLLMIGFVARFAYVKGFGRGSVKWRFVYGIVFFSLVMSAFDDQFLRGYIYYFGAGFLLSILRIINVRHSKFV